MRTWITQEGNKIIQLLSGRSNVFLLTNGRKNILIDTSAEFMWHKLQKRLEIAGIEKIALLALTHSHFDHASNTARLKDKYNALVLIHRSEAGYLSEGDNIIPTGTNAFTKFMVRTFTHKFRAMGRYQPCTPDITFDDTYSLSDLGFNAYLMHTPGHTQGSASLIIDDEIALVGDTMFGIFPRTVFPPFAADQVQLLESWEKLLKTKCSLFFPSHGSVNARALVEKDFMNKISLTGFSKKVMLPVKKQKK